MHYLVTRLIKPALLVYLFCYAMITLPVFGQGLVISEFMAINNETISDDDGDYADWIEIHNSGNEPVSLLNWSLSDNPDNLIKWQFPEITIEAGAYMLIWASEKKRKDIEKPLHTNFKLSGSGEFLVLLNPEGQFISGFENTYPAQEQDVSYGLYEGNYIYMTEPTPGSENQPGDRIIPPSFSQHRGFYDDAFSLELSANAGNQIIYTLDGSVPTLSHGLEYSDPISINKTTVISAITIESNTQEISRVTTHTYLLPDVMSQNNSPSGYPGVWGQGFPGDYEMDPEICTEDNKPAVWNSLKSLPTVSLVLNVDHLFLDSEDDTKAGIYLNSTKASEAWERPTSIEYFNTENDLQFQFNAGLRVHGGNGRKPGNSPKHSFRVSFRSSYGPSKLNFNLFDKNGAVNEFNSIVLRAGYNYSWLKNNPTQCAETDYIRDPFTKESQRDMDRLSTHTNFAHLFLNGIYWGVYNISEKVTNDFAESYLGGKEEDYDVVKDHNGVTDGDRVAWDSLLSLVSAGFETNAKYFSAQGKNEDGTDNPELANLLDVRNLTDYILLNYYIGNGDWDRNNWLALRNRVSNEHGFKFLCWDAETSMNELDKDITDTNNEGNPTAIFNALLKNEEYRLYLADRIHKHFYNGGDLTPEKTIRRYQEIAGEIEQSMLAESARWGDYRRDVDGGSNYTLYTLEDHWKPQVAYMQETYLPQRSGIVLEQLIKAGFYAEVEAPKFSTHGGDFEEPVEITITAEQGDIYYTVDDTDPRLVGGAVSENSEQYAGAIMVNKDMTIQARALHDGIWSALTKTDFKVDNVTESLEPDSVSISLTICEGEAAYGYTSEGVYYLESKASNGADSITTLTLTVEDCTAEILNTTQSKFTIFPNPASHEIQIECAKNNPAGMIEIASVTGKTIKRIYFESNSSKATVDISDLEQGIYLIRSNSKEGTYLMRLIKR